MRVEWRNSIVSCLTISDRHLACDARPTLPRMHRHPHCRSVAIGLIVGTSFSNFHHSPSMQLRRIGFSVLPVVSPVFASLGAQHHCVSRPGVWTVPSGDSVARTFGTGTLRGDWVTSHGTALQVTYFRTSDGRVPTAFVLWLDPGVIVHVQYASPERPARDPLGVLLSHRAINSSNAVGDTAIANGPVMELRPRRDLPTATSALRFAMNSCPASSS